eukprot:12250958-Ditylum_brightwellii.AAC.1
MREAQMKKAENIMRGHRQYRTIMQDKNLPECAGSEKTVDRLTGFEGLVIDPNYPDKWHTGRLQQCALCSCGA